jgi:hypothetical protein
VPDRGCWADWAGHTGVRQADRARVIVLDVNEQRLDFCRRVMGVAHRESIGSARSGARADRRAPAGRGD